WERPGISGAWLHAQFEDFDKAMKNAHGENWEEEHLDLDGQIIYEAAGRIKEEKVKFKSKRVMASSQCDAAREDQRGVDFDGIMQSVQDL
ncbi:hypothetical protein ZWY2020_041326, partial [Hordeum vulgare]